MLYIIWSTGHPYQEEWESHWLQELFKSIECEYTIINLNDIDLSRAQIIPNPIIVLNHAHEHMAYLQRYEAFNAPFGIIHLSDEWLKDWTEFYNYSSCKFVLRNYYEIKYALPKVNFFSLGYKINFWKDYIGAEPDSITENDREFIWSFAGSPKHTRESTLSLFTSLQPNKIIWETGDIWTGKNITGLDTYEYRSLLLNSVFVICLEGWASVDSFRTCEALECGCIPVVRDCSYWKGLFNEMPPFIVADTWEENYTIIKSLSQKDIENKRRECYVFWNKHKMVYKTILKDLVQEHLCIIKPIYHTFLCAGLGNRIFQYACVKALAKKNNAEFNIIGQESEILHHNGNSYEWLSSRFINKPLQASLWQNTKEDFLNRGMHVYEQPINEHIGTYNIDLSQMNSNNNILFLGFFQSEDYFENIADELKDTLKISDNVATILKSIEASINIKLCDIHAIHIRLGDFINYYYEKHFINLDKYYKTCITRLREMNNNEQMTFIIVCEEPSKIGEVYPDLLGFIQSKDKCIITNPEQAIEEIDFYLLTACKSVITANSTFSWWAGWLSTGMVFIPSIIVNRDDKPCLHMKKAIVVDV